MSYLLDYDYSSSCKLCRDEVIFYYIRKEKKGVYYDLFQEFDKELAAGEYDLLPLVRPTADDVEKTRALARHNAESLNLIVGMSDTLLKGFAQQKDDQEILSRDGVQRKDGILYNPEAQKTAVAAVAAMCEGGESTTAAGRKRKASGELGEIRDFGLRSLSSMNTKSQLQEIARKEKVNVRGAKKKDDYAKLIHEHRERLATPPSSIDALDAPL